MQSSIIREKIQQTIQSDPDIDLVKLVNAETLTEVLTVNPDPNKGNVYFKHVTRPQELDGKIISLCAVCGYRIFLNLV